MSTFKIAFLELEIFSILKLKLLHWKSYCLWKSKISFDSQCIKYHVWLHPSSILGVNSLFVNMTWENPISFYCEIKVVIIIIIIIIYRNTRFKWIWKTPDMLCQAGYAKYLDRTALSWPLKRTAGLQTPESNNSVSWNNDHLQGNILRILLILLLLILFCEINIFEKNK